MDKELTLDAISKIEAVQHVRARYSKSKIYHIGELIYMVRSKYAMMLRLYFRCVRNLENMSHNSLIIELGRITKLASDIYHCTAALDDFTKTEAYTEAELDMGAVPKRRSGGVSRRPTLTPLSAESLRRSLEAAGNSLREIVHRRNEAIAVAYPATRALVPDVFYKLKQITHNWTELVTNKTAAKEFMYGAQLQLM